MLVDPLLDTAPMEVHVGTHNVAVGIKLAAMGHKVSVTAT